MNLFYDLMMVRIYARIFRRCYEQPLSLQLLLTIGNRSKN